MSLVAVATPETESLAAVMVSLLEANGIPYVVRGGGFASMLPGLQIGRLPSRAILVPEEEARHAREVLSVLDSEVTGEE